MFKDELYTMLDEIESILETTIAEKIMPSLRTNIYIKDVRNIYEGDRVFTLEDDGLEPPPSQLLSVKVFNIHDNTRQTRASNLLEITKRELSNNIIKAVMNQLKNVINVDIINSICISIEGTGFCKVEKNGDVVVLFKMSILNTGV